MLNYLKERQEVCNITSNMSAAGLVVGSWGNASTRLTEKEILITPSALGYDNMKPSDLMIVDMKGRALQGKHKPSSELLLHLAVYESRSDVSAIVHTHSVYATSLAVARRSLPPIVEDLIQTVGGEVRVAPYGHPGSKELAFNCNSSLQERNAVLLANHGLVGVGKTLSEALEVCLVVEKAAKIYLLAGLAGKPYILDEDTVSFLYKQFQDYKVQ